MASSCTCLALHTYVAVCPFSHLSVCQSVFQSEGRAIHQFCTPLVIMENGMEWDGIRSQQRDDEKGMEWKEVDLVSK